MWSEKLANGRYKFCERFTDPMSGQRKKVSVVMDKNTKATEKLARDILRQKMETPAESGITFGDLCAMYLADQKPLIKASTYGRNAGSLHSLQTILGENTRADKLSAGYIRRKLLETGREAGTLNEWLKRLKAALRWAYKNDLIEDARFIDKLESFRDIPKSQKVEDKFLEADELSDLLESMTMELWRDLTLFLALSGLRIGEAAALTRSDVDLTRRRISVTKNYDYNNGLTTTPKNHSSNREVYIQDELYDVCARILYADKVLSISNLFFTYNGDHLHYDAYRQYLGDHSEDVLGRRITPHALRHTHASLMMEAGMDVDSIAARLGHANSRITREIYLHVTKKLEEKRNEWMKEVRLVAK